MRISYRCTFGVFYSILINEANCLTFYRFILIFLSGKTCYILSECSDGFSGVNCSKMCIYPSYGPKCKSECACSSDSCHFANGCPNESTSKCLIQA